MPGDILAIIETDKATVEYEMQEEGYIDGWNVAKDGQFQSLTITLKYSDSRERVIKGLKRISKPGRRIYAKHDRLPKVLGGLGTAILSTPTGVITSRQAAERGIAA